MLDGKKTLSSLKQHSNSLYSLDWYGDVDVDYLLSFDIARSCDILPPLNQ